MGLRRSFKPTNLVQNGDFSKGTAGWLANYSTLTVANNIGTNIPNGTDYIGRMEQTVSNQTINHKVYFTAKIRVTNSVLNNVQVYVYDTSPTFAYNAKPSINVWTKTSGLATLNSTSFRLFSRQEYADAATAKDKVMEVKEVLAIDLTALFGAGNEPDLAWCDLNIPVWFDGTLGNGVINGTGGLK